MPVKKRGSTKLAGGRPLSDVELKKLVAVTKAKGVKILDWRDKGQPGIDSVYGSLQVSTRLAPKVIRDLISLRGMRLNLEVFPLGIPTPLNVNIRFHN